MKDSALIRTVSTIATAASKLLPPPANWIAALVAEGLALAADFSRAGADPLVRIRRIRDTDPLLVEIDRRWQAAMLKRWGQIAAKVPEDSQEDIYEDVDTIARS